MTEIWLTHLNVAQGLKPPTLDAPHVGLVLIPAYNEARALGPVLQALRTHLSEWTLLVIDDGSTDATAEVARAAGADVVLRLPCNLGIGGAVQTGFQYAARHGFRRVVRLDADGQHAASAIAAMIAAQEAEQADVVVGSRFVGERSFQSTLSRRLGIWVLSTLTRVLTGAIVKDVTSGFRIYGERALPLLAYDYPINYPEPDENVFLLRRGLKLIEVSAQMHERTAGTSSIRGLGSLLYMVEVSLSMIMTAVRPAHKGER